MKREDVEQQYKWNLGDIYADREAWQKDFDEVEKGMLTYQNYKGKLNEPNSLLAFLELDETLSNKMEKIYVYSALLNDEDTRNSDAQRLVEKSSNLSAKIGEATSFVVPEILEMDEDEFLTMIKQSEELKIYEKMMRKIFRTKKHVLSKEEEALLAKLSDNTGVADSVFAILNNADIEFPEIEVEDGKRVKLTKSNYSIYVESENREVRERAYRALYETYMGVKNTIGTTLYANIKENVMYSKIRGYNSALENSLFRDDVSKEVYMNLINTTKENLQPLHKYLELRKNILGVEELRMWDIYLPLIKNVDAKISYEEAYSTMMEGLSVLGEDYVDLLKRAKNERWIDIYENEGKRGGAYSWGAYGTHPYVLLNYRDDMDSMFTLAHEMGHALHSYYSDEENPSIYAQYAIFVAEVASTVNEVLLMHHLLNKAKNDKDTEMEKYLLNQFLENYRGTLFRQVMFAEFEHLTHQKVEEGVPLTHEDFRDIYLTLHKEYYGDKVVHDEQIAYEWTRIPHFYTPFYVYKYATGFSAAITIADAILNEGETAVESYKRFLRSGGTDFPIELLKIAGVDMAKKEPIEHALQYFKGLVERFEELTKEK